MKELAISMIESHVFVMGYIGVLIATMIIPVFIITSWYSRNMELAKGGKQLMADHEASDSANAHTRSSGANLPQDKIRGAASEFTTAGKLNEKLMSGAYGKDVKAIQVQTYKYFAYWVLAIVLLIGVMVCLMWTAGRL